MARAFTSGDGLLTRKAAARGRTRLPTALARFVRAGLWPALPLTGYWLLPRQGLGHANDAGSWLAWVALVCAAGLAVWSVALLAAATAGVYRAELFGFAGWATTLLSLSLLANPERWADLRAVEWSPWDGALAAGLAVAAGFYIGFPTDSIVGGDDMGIYANHAMCMARTGRLDVPYPWPATTAPGLSLTLQAVSKVRPDCGPRGVPLADTYLFHGFFKTDAAMTGQLPPLFSLWLAHAVCTLGARGLFRLNAVFAFLSLAAFYGLCSLLVPKPLAVAATLFLALNPSQLWLSRNTLSEILAQLFLWSGLLLLTRSLLDLQVAGARWAGLFFGLAVLVRGDCLFLLPLLLLAEALYTVVGRHGDAIAAAWPPVYQTALPLVALFLGHLGIWNRPYFRVLFPYLWRIGLLAAACLGCVLGMAHVDGEALRTWLAGDRVLAVVGLGVLSLCAYAYWVRPHIGTPYKMNWPGNPLHGTRYYREYSLVNLGRYLSPAVIWAGIFGWLLTLAAVVQGRLGPAWAVALAVIGGYSTLYIWDYSNHPFHFEAIRRFVPVIIPGFLLFAARGTGWVLDQLPAGWLLPAATGVVGFLVVFTARAGALIWLFPEGRGYYGQIQSLAERLPEDSLILAHGGAEWLTPLGVAFGKRVVPIDLTSDRGRAFFEGCVADRLREGRPTYLLCEGEVGFLPPPLTEEWRLHLSRSECERTVHPIPRRVITHRTRVSLLQIPRGAAWPPQYIDAPLLLSWVCWPAEASGFYACERLDGHLIRWTNGLGRLVVPLDARTRPTRLRVDIASTGDHRTKLQVLVNGHELEHAQLSQQTWRKTFELSDIPLGAQLVIELRSDTFVPSDTNRATADNRTLGVMVRDVRLIAPTMEDSTHVLGDWR